MERIAAGVVDSSTKHVLTVAYMNKESVKIADLKAAMAKAGIPTRM